MPYHKNHMTILHNTWLMTHTVPDNLMFPTEMSSTFKVIKICLEKSYDKQRLTVLVILCDIYDTHQGLIHKLSILNDHLWMIFYFYIESYAVVTTFSRVFLHNNFLNNDYKTRYWFTLFHGNYFHKNNNKKNFLCDSCSHRILNN